MAFLEEYTLLDELGQGGYATVYKVRHNKLGYIRAIRVLNAIIAHGEEDKTYQKFLEECRLLLRLGNGNHPNIVHIYQPLLRAQRAIVEMDYVDGVDLFHHLEKKSGYVETKEVIKLLSDIGSALAYCHENIYKFCMDKDEDNLKDDPNDGSKLLIDDKTRQRLINKYRVIHNDIHSGNIIRREDGNFVLLDFGLAIDGDSIVRSSRRRNGAPEFKAPEKWDNEGTLTTQSDIYSFGVVLYEFLAGRVPFLFNKQNSNPIEAEYLLGKAHKEEQPESIFALRKGAFEKTHPGESYEQDYPQWLEDVIMKCLAKNPEERYRNGKDLFVQISQFINAESMQKVSLKKNDEYENKLKELRTSLLSYQEGFARLQYELRESTISKESLYKEVRYLTKENASLRGQVKELEGLSSDNKEIIRSISNELNESKRKLEEAQSEISKLNDKINTIPPPDSSGRKWRTMFLVLILIALGTYRYYHYCENIRSLSSQVNELEKINNGDTNNSDEIIQLRDQVSTLEKQIQVYKTQIAALKSNGSTSVQYERTINQLNVQISDLKAQIAQKDKEIQVLKDTYVE